MTLKELLYKKLRYWQREEECLELDEEIFTMIEKTTFKNETRRILGWISDFYPDKYPEIKKILEVQK